MRALLLALALFVAAPAVHADELFGQQILDTGAFACSTAAAPAPVETTWANPHTFPIRIVNVQIWGGGSFDHAMDLGVIIARLSDSNVLARYLHDRYSRPGGIISERTNLWPGVVLQPGDSLWIKYKCVKIDATKQATAHYGIDVWWVQEPE